MAEEGKRRLPRPGLGAVGALLAVVAVAAYMFHLSGGTAGQFRGRAGELLVADEDMPDGRFRQSVILVIRHDEQGAFGVIINKPKAVDGKVPLWALLGDRDDKGEAYRREVELHFGGPVDLRRLVVVHDDGYATDGTVRLSNGLAATVSGAPLHDLAKDRGPARHLLTLGYAGWGPGQLDWEVNRGSWHWVPAEAGFVFDRAHGKKWAKAYARRGVDL